MKTSEVTGLALSWLVGRCEGFGEGYMNNIDICLNTKRKGSCIRVPINRAYVQWNPATDWAQGGPIVERERIRLTTTLLDGDVEAWEARMDTMQSWLTAHTPLVAAMRCYVASKLGDEVEIPEELK